MPRPRAALIVALIASVACTGGRSNGSSRSAFIDTPCPADVDIVLLVPHSCGYLTVPEDRARPTGRDVGVFVVRMDPPDADPRPDPIMVTGGEMGASPNYGVLQAIPQLVHRVVYVMAPRGTGHSRPSLGCPEADASVRAVSAVTDVALQRFLTAVEVCRSRLAAEGVDPGNFNLRAMARDVEDLRLALGVPSWNLMSTGSGSRLALEVMRTFPEHIRSSTLDSPQFPQLSEPAGLAVGAGLTMRSVFAACAAQRSCRMAHPHLRRTWDAAVARLDRDPVKTRVNGIELLVDASSFIRGLQAFIADDTASLPVIPSIVSGAAHGRIDPELAHELTIGGGLCSGYRARCEPGFSLGVYLSVLCEDERGATIPAGLPRSPSGLAGVRVAYARNPYLAACSAWRVTRTTMKEPVATPVPTLLVAGRFDLFAPPELTRLLGASLPRSFVLEVPDQDHTPLDRAGCNVAVWQGWLQDPGSTPPGAECLAGATVRFAR